jgi:hypothetical protein
MEGGGQDIIVLTNFIKFCFEFLLDGFVGAVNGLRERGRSQDGRAELGLSVVLRLF